MEKSPSQTPPQHQTFTTMDNDTEEQQSGSTDEMAGNPLTGSDSRESTQDCTTTPSSSSGNGKNIKALSDGLQHLSVSPPRQRENEQDTAMKRDSTPPTPRPLSSKAAATTPTRREPLPRNRSSPSLLDASPKPTVQPPATLPRRSPKPTSSPHQRTARPHELTPVTRNTSEVNAYVDEKRTSQEGAVVSPEERLHGEHLALPTGDDYNSNTKIHQPALQQRRLSAQEGTNVGSNRATPYLQVGSRANSLGKLEAAAISRQSNQESLVSDDEVAGIDDLDVNIEKSIQFPARKIYSFTSGQQYKAAVEQERGAFLPQRPVPPSWAAAGLKPYQPTRSDLEDVGLAREETSGIFIARHRNNEDGSGRNLANPILMEERQWSIPSIRMANHVQGSTTSYTDEEDELCRGYDDDASLSSRGSSLYLPDDTAAASTEAMAMRLGTTGSFQQPVVIEDGMDQVFHEDNLVDNSAVAVAFQEDSKPPHQRKKKRSKKHDDKERQAYEWLRTVELGRENNVICEAASSKFLTGNFSGAAQVPQALPPRIPLNRTDSSPATISGRIPDKK